MFLPVIDKKGGIWGQGQTEEGCQTGQLFKTEQQR